MLIRILDSGIFFWTRDPGRKKFPIRNTARQGTSTWTVVLHHFPPRYTVEFWIQDNFVVISFFCQKHPVRSDKWLVWIRNTVNNPSSTIRLRCTGMVPVPSCTNTTRKVGSLQSVLWIRIHLDPHSFGCLGSESVLGLRIRIQKHGNWPKFTNKPGFLLFKTAFVPS